MEYTQPLPQTGQVREADESCCNLSGAEAWGSLNLLLPYGVYAKPPQGSQCVVLPLGEGERLNLAAPFPPRGWSRGKSSCKAPGGAI